MTGQKLTGQKIKHCSTLAGNLLHFVININHLSTPAIMNFEARKVSQRMKNSILRMVVVTMFAGIGITVPAIAQQTHKPAFMPKRENLGPAVNSEYDEVFPVISADAKTLYFVRKGHPENTGSKLEDDIWVSERLPDGSWSKARNIGSPLNTDGFNFVCAVLPDNNTLLLGNQYMRDGSQRQGLSLSYREGDSWGFPTPLIIDNLGNLSNLTEYTMAPDGRVIVMSILRKDSIGGRDLYVSFRKPDNTWSEPENMGPVINSPEQDVTPFIAADGVTLYFSSNRPGGFGSNDVYMARRLDYTWKNWSTPRNLGYPINTAGWDAYYTVPGNGEFAYFVSTSEGYGKSDLFRIELPEDARPIPVMMVSGRVRDPKGQIIPASITYERLSDGEVIGSATADPSTGEYTIALPMGHQYGFHANADGHYPVSQHLDLTDLSNFKEVERDLILAPLTRGTSIRLNNLFFDFDKDILRDESKPELDRLVRFLREHPSMIIQVDGHTDSVGGFEYNMDLSRRRAKAVVDYIVAKGVSDVRLIPRGFGKTRPVAENETEEGRQLNRRVEYSILQE
jgi:outer membrane protein OmpA-like peptidoglycan-associated protein